MRILGLDFFDGTVSEAVDRAFDRRGLVVAPSGTCFQRLQKDESYRNAMTHADLVLPDSGFMVLLWRGIKGGRIPRISGLTYPKELLSRADFRRDRSVLWVLPHEGAKAMTLSWLQNHGYLTTAADCYVAPMYGRHVEDSRLLELVRARRPGHVVIALSGGVQEKLGFYLREQDSHRPALHCIGGAFGFIAGYQVAIPPWADRLYLGWLLRLLSDPRRFLPRALNALALPSLILKYGDKLPAEKS